MKIRNILTKCYSKYSKWSNLTEKTFKPNTTSVVYNDGEHDFRYRQTKDQNNITKQLLTRHLDTEEEVLCRPVSNADKKAFNFFIEEDEPTLQYLENKYTKNIASHELRALRHGVARNFATIKNKHGDVLSEKKLNIEPELSVTTSIGEKIVRGISIFHNGIEINDFMDSENTLLARLQLYKHKEVSRPITHIKSHNTDWEESDYVTQYALYDIDRGFYKSIILDVTIKVSTHFTGMVSIDDKGQAIIEYSDDGRTRPKTDYTPKENFVSMEGARGITASLKFIVYKTQPSIQDEKYDLIFIPINHPAISKIHRLSCILSEIKNLSKLSDEEITTIITKHGVSSKEVIVELFDEIAKNDSKNGVFFISAGQFSKQHQKICEFILENSMIKDHVSYLLEVSKEKDSFNEPILFLQEEQYTPADQFNVIGDSTDL